MLPSSLRVDGAKLDALHLGVRRWLNSFQTINFDTLIPQYTNYMTIAARDVITNHKGAVCFVVFNGIILLKHRLYSGEDKTSQSSISVNIDGTPASSRRSHVRESMFFVDKGDSDSHSEISSYDDQIDHWLTDSDLSPNGSRSTTPNSFSNSSYESPLTVGVESVERGVLLTEETYSIECNMIITSNALFESPTKMQVIDNSLNSTSNLSIKHVNKWIIKKRLSEFLEFIQIISKEFPKIIFELPKNSGIYETDDYMEFKRLALHEYINCLSNHEEFMRKLSLFLKLAIFLDPPYGTRFFALAK